MDTHIKIKKSTIPKAGKGVFAQESFKKGEIIGKYTGERISKKTFDEFTNARRAYVLEIIKSNRRYLVDAFDPEKSGWPRYINHHPKRTKPNVEFMEDGRIQVIRYIKPGDELFIDYGDDYWVEQDPS